MTDLNDLIANDSPLVLINASAINARGQIAGLALQPSTGELPAFLATPRHPELTGERARNAQRGARRTVAIPPNVGKMLREVVVMP